MKKCTKCLEFKEYEHFSTNKKTSDGKHSWCKQCINQQRRDKKYKPTIRGKEYKKEYDKKRRITDEYKKMKSLSDKKYREKMGEILLEKKRIYYSDKQHLRRNEYQRNKSGYIKRAYERAKNIKNLMPYDADKIKIQFFYNDAKRLTDETGIKHEVDHIIPVSKGGLHHHDNLQVLTWIENRKKGAKIATTVKGKEAS